MVLRRRLVHFIQLYFDLSVFKRILALANHWNRSLSIIVSRYIKLICAFCVLLIINDIFLMTTFNV